MPEGSGFIPIRLTADIDPDGTAPWTDDTQMARGRLSPIAFRHLDDFALAIRHAVAAGGDTDTVAAIASTA